MILKIKAQIILIIVIFFTLYSDLLGQDFHFPDSNAIWSVYNEKYFVQGDSIYNSFDYNKYFLSCDSTVITGSFFALLREDTITKKIFAIPAGSENERLLYDFSLNLNDTCTVYPLSFMYYSGPIRIKVDEIDSILLNDEQYHQRKKIIGIDANTHIAEYWIDGIGSTFGLFNSGLTGIGYADISYPTLLCFEQDGLIVFDNPVFIDCYEPYPPAIVESYDPENVFIYPNPGTNQLNIRISNSDLKFEMMNLNGQLVLERLVNSNNNSINTEILKPGMYFFKLSDSNNKNIKHGKWIKK